LLAVVVAVMVVVLDRLEAVVLVVIVNPQDCRWRSELLIPLRLAAAALVEQVMVMAGMATTLFSAQ
jgi:hypothetical protein